MCGMLYGLLFHTKQLPITCWVCQDLRLVYPDEETDPFSFCFIEKIHFSSSAYAAGLPEGGPLVCAKYIVSDRLLGTAELTDANNASDTLDDLIQRPCYQRGSPCQDPAGNRTTGRPPDYGKETQTAVVWSCLPFIRSGQNHFASYSERGKKSRQTEEKVGRQQQGMDRPGVRQVPEGSGEQGKMEETGCEIICGAPTTLSIKRQIG